MSKLIQRLEQIERSSPTPIGFGSSVVRERLPTMGLIGILSAAGKTPIKKAFGSAVDGLLLENSNPPIPGGFKGGEEQIPWGSRIGKATPEGVAEQRANGCDFLVVGFEGTRLTALPPNGVAYFLELGSDVDDKLLRGLEDLPVDGVYLDLGVKGSSLTLEHLISVAGLRASFSRYLVVKVDGLVSEIELQNLSQIGVNGIAVELNSLSGKKMDQLCDRLGSLSHRRPKRGERSVAVVPSMPGASFTVSHGDGEEDDEGEEIDD